ncbi:copper homeostasis protein [Amycolatopsis marina]|uniref:Copper homeostasis protein cutC homolog n=1 Tax=Amycolatopsis marina TaxID=490629 RepID=A0A1I1CHC1_9PSEU|nr:copper homeostasis protein CutC [Amycolatopsis marina]SFB60070.1 copper homeostasis protein [Amycolatopsis marina]
MSERSGLLEVIALGPRDAECAQEGGADRLELVADMAADGLTPAVRVVREVLAATDLPVRVMLRDSASFAAADPAGLRAAAAELADAGAREFVLGFLTVAGRVDRAACTELIAVLPGCAWTFHRAVDHAADVVAAHRELAGLGCDTVLSAGHPAGVEHGREVLTEVAVRSEPPVLLVGGGLREGMVAPLRAAGVRAFHVGSAVRPGGWESTVDVDAVRRWSRQVHDPLNATAAPPATGRTGTASS